MSITKNTTKLYKELQEYWQEGIDVSSIILESELNIELDQETIDLNESGGNKYHLMNKSGLIQKILCVIYNYLNLQTKDITNINTNIFEEFKQNINKEEYKTTCGFVYLGTDGKIFKIGSTNDLQKRENTFETANIYYKMITSIIYYKMITSIYVNDYKKLEKCLHKLFLNKQIKKEWFSLDSKDIAFLIQNGFELYLN